MIRLTVAGLAFACCGLAASPGSAQVSAGDLYVKVDQLENQVRQLTGAIEQLQFRNQQLEASLKRLQDDFESRSGERGAPRVSAQAIPARPAVQPAAPSMPPPGPPGRRSDAFDPSHSPGAPGVPRTLEGSPYAQRRAESEAVAARLGLRVLRDATLEQVRDIPRGRHAVTEMQRVQDFARALRGRDLEALGPLMLASHASSRNDMEVSIPELDVLVECLVEAGAYGARLTGAGFGGCVVALGPVGSIRAIADRATEQYRARTGLEPSAWVVRGADGACRTG